uniref:Reverse transcriptase domain-containing protein n=1 Tax=Fagus sylvatica TaxID=28930 RepID=A0A2N9GT53_FAGSY
MPPRTRQASAYTVNSKAESQNHEQEQHQPKQNIPDEKSYEVKNDHQDGQNHHEKPQQESGSHNNKDEPFIIMLDVADLLQQEREKIPKEPRHFVRKPPYLAKLLKQPYPNKYVVPTFSLFDGLSGSAFVHVSKFIDSMGPYADNGDLCFCGSISHASWQTLLAQAPTHIFNLSPICEGCGGPDCPQQEGHESREGSSQPSYYAIEEPDDSELADATGKSAVAEESTTANPKVSAKVEYEVIDLSSDSNVQKPVSISAFLFALEITQLVAFFKEYQDVFAWQYNEMPRIDPTLVAHSLNVETGAKPMVQPMRTFHSEVEAQISQEVKKLLSAGFIKPIWHPRWLSNIVPMKKKNDQIRCYVDFRDLNKACPKDEFPLPNMDLLIDSTTAFRTPIGNFYYTVMPFGLKNVETTYQRTMMAMFHDMIHREIEDCVDDIVVKSKEREDHFTILRKVFERCRLYKLKMNPLKCAYGFSTNKFLGFLVHQRGMDVDPMRASTIATMKPPTTHKELKSFLGKLSYIRRFIPSLTAITSTFAPLLKKGVPFRWSLECQQAFEKWLLQLSQYEIITETPITIKSQAIADLLAQFPGEDKTIVSDEVLGKVDEVLMADTIWTLRFDGSSTAVSSGVGIVLFRDDGKLYQSLLSLIFHDLTMPRSMRLIL